MLRRRIRPILARSPSERGRSLDRSGSLHRCFVGHGRARVNGGGSGVVCLHRLLLEAILLGGRRSALRAVSPLGEFVGAVPTDGLYHRSTVINARA